MSRSFGLVLLGANGSGKSTLGRALAQVFQLAHFDAEDYWFYQTDIPYTAARPQEERKALLLSDMKKHGSYVVSGDVSGWGEEFPLLFDLAVFLKAPVDVRMNRIELREYARWGNRVREGGDLFLSQKSFRAFAATRDVGLLEQRALSYACPLLYVDSTIAFNETVDEIASHITHVTSVLSKL